MIQQITQLAVAYVPVSPLHMLCLLAIEKALRPLLAHNKTEILSVPFFHFLNCIIIFILNLAFLQTTFQFHSNP